MKKTFPACLIATSLLIAPLAGWSRTTIFNDNFGNGSTLNGASTPGGTPEASWTSYDVASTKNGTTCALTAGSPGLLRMKLSGGTTAGYIEMQAMFASAPVQLVNVGDKINLTVVFTNSAGTLLAGGSGSLINVGLFNSGGSAPAPGFLNNLGLNGSATNIVGYCTNWQGYVGQINYSGANSAIFTRPVQTGASPNDGVQDLLFSGAGTGLYKFPSGTTIGSTMTSAVTLTSGGTYTRSFTILVSNPNEVTITDELYSGSVVSGIPLSSLVRITSGGTTYTNFANQFDGLAIGIANKGTSMNPQMDISQITIVKSTLADEPGLYNLQLNGFTNNTFSGAAQIGGSGDLWNNPDWIGVYSGSTNLFSGVTVLESKGGNRGVTVTMTAAYDNNTTAWNDGGVFNHYTGQTAGSATPILMDQVVKVDYSHTVNAVNVMTLVFSGLPTNTPVTAYVYGAGNGSGQGGLWSLGAANGGGSAVVGYDGSATGRNVTLASSKGIGWNSITGVSDGSGNLTVTATGTHANSVWYQTYMNGIQLQVGGTAPAIFGLTNQTVEAGSTVIMNPLVTGNPPPTYQWQTNGVNITDATNSTLTLTNVTTGQSGYVYSLIAVNPIGVVTNSITLTVNVPVYSTMSVTAVSPNNGATGICYDTPLTVTFSDTVTLGTSGSINIFNTTNPTTPVDTISAANGLVQQRTFPGDNQSFSYQTFQINGNTVKIYPHFNVLTSNQTYYVTIDPKTFKDSGGTNFVGLTVTNAWQFSTKVGGPVDPNNPVVKADGSADFLTVQGAVNSIPAGTSASQRVINIRNGIYNEIVDIAGKHNVTFLGESRNGAVVAFPNNANFQAANGGTTHARMTFKVNANNVVLDTLTVSNSTPQGGSQAEALMIESNAKRCIVHNSEIDSRQDTILANVNSSQAYFYRSVIKGNFDYIWGGGNLYFDQCEIRTIAGASGFNLTAARTDTSATTSTNFPWANPGGTYTANGMSFVNCRFTAESGVTTVTLAGSNGTAGNNVSWYGCDFATNYVAPSASLFSGNFVFWQDLNTSNGVPVSYPVVTSIGGSDPRLLAATNIPTWFYGWQPQLPPNIAPVAGPNFTIGAVLNTPATVQIVGGKYSPTDVDGDALTITSVIGVTNGTVTTDGTNATYTATNGTMDSFTYTVSDGLGGTASAMVTVLISANVQGYNLLSATSLGNGSNVLTFAGIPTYNYALDLATNLAPPINWMPQATNPAASNGALIFTNLSTQPQTYYRTRYVP